MKGRSFNPRDERRRDLAKAKHDLFHRVDADIWIVPSATCSHYGYLVDTSRSMCTCPDVEGAAMCKHLWAVAYVQNEFTLIDRTQLAPPLARELAG